LPAPCGPALTLCPTPRDSKRGRPGPSAQPNPVTSPITGGLASPCAVRQALGARQRCFILATNERHTAPLPPQERFAGDPGQVHVERAWRCLKDPCFRASSRALNKPERIMALLMVMPVGWRGEAAWEERLRTARKDRGAAVPNPKRPRVQNPTARWVFSAFVGMHRLRIPHPWPLGVTLTDAPQHRLQRLGEQYAWFSRGLFPSISAAVRNVGWGSRLSVSSSL
jgi:hypothetical protein